MVQVHRNSNIYLVLTLFIVDCEWSKFGDWSNCSQPCGGRKKYSKRFKTQSALHGGKECEGPSERVESCNINECQGT